MPKLARESSGVSLILNGVLITLLMYKLSIINTHVYIDPFEPFDNVNTPVQSAEHVHPKISLSSFATYLGSDPILRQPLICFLGVCIF
jgi:hypothetical protein